MILQKETPEVLRRRGAAAATASFGFLAAVLATGCGPKEAATTPAAPAPGAPAVAGAPAPETKLTPEQEAVRKRAMEQGPAVQAALQRQEQQNQQRNQQGK